MIDTYANQTTEDLQADLKLAARLYEELTAKGQEGAARMVEIEAEKVVQELRRRGVQATRS